MIFFSFLSREIFLRVVKKNKIEREDCSEMVLAIIVRVSSVAYKGRHKNKKTWRKKSEEEKS